jgi:hypothetical protein
LVNLKKDTNKKENLILLNQDPLNEELIKKIINFFMKNFPDYKNNDEIKDKEL